MASKSIITEYMDYCLLCGKPTVDTHHLVYGRSERKLADADGLTIPVCRECHDLIHGDTRIGNLSRVLGQIAWEGKYGSREDFRKRYGKSYT